MPQTHRCWPPPPKANRCAGSAPRCAVASSATASAPAPPKLDCAFETESETCVHFATGPAFVPVLLGQRDHAAEHHQATLVTVYDRLLEGIETDHEDPPGTCRQHSHLKGSPT
jgi:hypothetical protein